MDIEYCEACKQYAENYKGFCVRCESNKISAIPDGFKTKRRGRMIKKVKCNECTAQHDGVPECAIDGVCPYDFPDEDVMEDV